MKNYFEILSKENLGKVPALIDCNREVYYKLDAVQSVLGTEDEYGDIDRLREIGDVLGSKTVMRFRPGTQVVARRDGKEMDESMYGWYVTEVGLYFLIMQSKTPAALKMSAWLAGEVLVRLREKSKYTMGEEDA